LAVELVSFVVVSQSQIDSRDGRSSGHRDWLQPINDRDRIEGHLVAACIINVPLHRLDGSRTSEEPRPINTVVQSLIRVFVWPTVAHY